MTFLKLCFFEVIAAKGLLAYPRLNASPPLTHHCFGKEIPSALPILRHNTKRHVKQSHASGQPHLSCSTPQTSVLPKALCLNPRGRG